MNFLFILIISFLLNYNRYFALKLNLLINKIKNLNLLINNNNLYYF